MLQNTLHYSALEAGIVQTPAAFAFMVVARWSGSHLAHHHPRRPAGYEGIAGGIATTAQQVGAVSGLAALTVQP